MRVNVSSNSFKKNKTKKKESFTFYIKEAPGCSLTIHSEEHKKAFSRANEYARGCTFVTKIL